MNIVERRKKNPQIFTTNMTFFTKVQTEVWGFCCELNFESKGASDGKKSEKQIICLLLTFHVRR